MFLETDKGRTDSADCHWIYTYKFSSLIEEVIFTTCCRDGLMFLTFLYVGVCLCGLFYEGSC